jgi:hypothetical protein
MSSDAVLNVMKKRLRATITIEIEASDYREAAAHQDRLETHFTAVRDDYPDARIVLCERRGGTGAPERASPARPLYRRSGRLNSYE